MCDAGPRSSVLSFDIWGDIVRHAWLVERLVTSRARTTWTRFPTRTSSAGSLVSSRRFCIRTCPGARTLSFETRQGKDQLECLIEPVYGTMTLRWTRDGYELLYLDLTRVRGVEADKFRGRESLVAHFDEQTGLRPLRIQIRPALHVSWGTRDDADRPVSVEQQKLPL